MDKISLLESQPKRRKDSKLRKIEDRADYDQKVLSEQVNQSMLNTKQGEFPEVQYNAHMHMQLHALPLKDKFSVTPQVSSKKALHEVDRQHRNSISHFEQPNRTLSAMKVNVSGINPLSDPNWMSLDPQMHDPHSGRHFDDLTVSNLRKAHHIQGIKSVSHGSPSKRSGRD